MSFGLNTFTDIFTGAPAKQAAADTRNYLGGVQTQGNQTIDAGTAAARGALAGSYGTSRSDVGAGTDQALGYLDTAKGSYAPLSALGSKYGGATTLGMDSLGVNGPAGNENAVNAFRASPGYNWQLDQGLNAINRAQNARGMANSGNTDIEALKYGQGLADQDYRGWQSSLLGFTSPELSATGSAATGQAGAALAGSNIANQRGQMLADLAQRYGTGQAGLETGAAGQKVGLAQNIASPYSQTYGQEAAAQQQGSGKAWETLLGLGNLAAKASGVGGFGAPSFKVG